MDLHSHIDWTPLWVTAKVALPATLIALVLGTSLGLWLSRRSRKTRRWLDALILLPMILPPTVLGYFLLIIIGRRGTVGRAWEYVFGEPLVFTVGAAIIAACVGTIPLVARFLGAAFLSISRQTIEAARMDGASGWSLFYHIQLPQVGATMSAAAALAFARAVGDFGATLMVAGNLPGRTQTASIAIYDMINTGRDQEALAMVIVVSVISAAVLLLTPRLSDV